MSSLPIVVAADPGDDSAVVACTVPASGRVQLLSVWLVYGGTRPRNRRLDALENDLKQLPAPALVGVESTNTKTGRGRAKVRADTWVGLGAYRGMLLRSLYVATQVEPVSLLADAKRGWPLELAMGGRWRLTAGKRGDGSHRIQEACAFVDGWAAYSTRYLAENHADAAKSRLIDASEAALMCAVLGQRLRARR